MTVPKGALANEQETSPHYGKTLYIVIQINSSVKTFRAIVSGFTEAGEPKIKFGWEPVPLVRNLGSLWGQGPIVWYTFPNYWDAHAYALKCKHKTA